MFTLLLIVNVKKVVQLFVQHPIRVKSLWTLLVSSVHRVNSPNQHHLKHLKMVRRFQHDRHFNHPTYSKSLHLNIIHSSRNGRICAFSMSGVLFRYSFFSVYLLWLCFLFDCSVLRFREKESILERKNFFLDSLALQFIHIYIYI